MELQQFCTTLFILRITANLCFGQIIIETSTSKKSTNLEAVVKILSSCNESRLSTVGVAGNSSDILVASLSSDGKFSLILLDDNAPLIKTLPYKLQIFVITISASIELKKVLKKMRNYRWWNHMARFYIILQLSNGDECSVAYQILWTAWEMNLLETKFICENKTNGTLIFSFNPYTSDAPKSWQLESIHRGVKDHPWSLLVRKYHKNDNLCDNMDFDKTKNLGGYEIRSVVTQRKSTTKDFYIGNVTDVYDNIPSLYTGIAQSLRSTLNATVDFAVIDKRKIVYILTDMNKFDSGLFANQESIDIVLMSRNTQFMFRKSFTYPFDVDGQYILTQYRGDKSQLRKIISVFNVTSRIILCTVFLITMILFKFYSHRSSASAVLDVLRLILNGPMLKLPKNSAWRIYLSSLFILIVTIIGIYLGRIASILARREPLKNIDTLQDLVESDHKIFIRKNYFDYVLKDQIAKERFVELTTDNCSTEVLSQDSIAACISTHSSTMKSTARLKLHPSHYPLVKYNLAFVIRKNWPLEHKINQHIQKLVEANLVHRWRENDRQKFVLAVEALENKNRDRTRKVLALEDMGFAFAILAIGLGSAMCSFIVEFIIKRRARSKSFWVFGNFFRK